MRLRDGAGLILAGMACFWAVSCGAPASSSVRSDSKNMTQKLSLAAFANSDGPSQTDAVRFVEEKVKYGGGRERLKAALMHATIYQDREWLDRWVEAEIRSVLDKYMKGQSYTLAAYFKMTPPSQAHMLRRSRECISISIVCGREIDRKALLKKLSTHFGIEESQFDIEAMILRAA